MKKEYACETRTGMCTCGRAETAEIIQIIQSEQEYWNCMRDPKMTHRTDCRKRQQKRNRKCVFIIARIPRLCK